VPPGVTCRDEAGRLWDLLRMPRCQIRSGSGARMTFQLRVRNDNRRPKLVTLCAQCDPLDIDDPAAAISIMLPGED